MKTISLIGGMSWESSVQYYAIINRAVRDRLGAPHSAKIIMDSLDFGEIADLQRAGDWASLTQMMCGSALALERSGADCILVCTNTMHKCAPAIAEACSVPMLHIADTVGAAIEDQGLKIVALLGTAFTMEQDFYRKRLADNHGLEVIVPDDEERKEIHRVIYEELVAGVIKDASRASYGAIIARLAKQGAQGVILGCTEIMLLIDQTSSPVPLFDTTALHANAAVDFALAD